jgi:hypothetical protein
MNLVFAYHNGDAQLALKSAQAITAMGINMRHKATVCCSNNTLLIDEITLELQKSFPTVERLIAQDGYNGWPLGPNQMFSDASSHCYATEEPWYFWEPDCVPMVERWMDKLEDDFNSKPAIVGCMYEGGMAPSGKNVYKAIVGSAVYPHNVLDYCDLAKNLNNYNLAYRNAGVIPEPWDIYCRWEFMAIGRNTPLIRAYWQSVNYQWQGNDVRFYAQSPEAHEIQEVTCPTRLVDKDAAVIHGCKDGSLHQMAIDRFEITQPILKEKDTTISVKTPLKQTEGRKKRNLSDEERKRRSEAMKAMVAKRKQSLIERSA